MAQQTAVEWLSERLIRMIPTISPIYKYDIKEYVEQAKVMEKEHIMKAFSDGQETPINNPTLPHYSKEEYYNEQYGK